MHSADTGNERFDGRVRRENQSRGVRLRRGDHGTAVRKILYTVRTAATKGQCNGGVAWSCGPYIDQTWEEGVRELLGELGDLLRGHEGIYGTVPGKSYVTQPEALLEGGDWGVSTESPDGRTVYLHVLNLPADGVLTLPRPADRKKFTQAFCGEQPLDLQKDGKGYRIVLPDHCDPIDTVIRLTADY